MGTGLPSCATTFMTRLPGTKRKKDGFVDLVPREPYRKAPCRLLKLDLLGGLGKACKLSTDLDQSPRVAKEQMGGNCQERRQWIEFLSQQPWCATQRAHFVAG